MTIYNINTMQLQLVISKGSVLIGELCELLRRQWLGYSFRGFRVNRDIEMEILTFFFSSCYFLCVVLLINIIIINVSMLLSHPLNWNLLLFLPELSHFDLECNSYKQMVKTRLLRISKFQNSQVIPLKMTFPLICQVVKHFNFLLT